MMLAALIALALSQAPAGDWTALTTTLTRAVNSGDLAALKTARAGALKAVIASTAGVAPAAAHYTLAYADYRIAADSRTGAGERQEFADEAEQHLREAIRQNDRFADAHALLSAVLGLKIGWAASVEAKMTLGPESGAALDRALALEPDNPRVLLISGIGYFRRPAEYGGDAKQAEALFRRAAERLDADQGDAWPNWGRFDAHVWLGQALARRGDAEGARQEYTKALGIAPGSTWVRDILLPAVGKKSVE